MAMRPEWKVENIVASVTLYVDIPLIQLSKTLSDAEYNPDEFPGLIYYISRKPKRSVLIFGTGKLVCAGAKTMEQIREMVDHVRMILKKIGIHATQEPLIEVQNVVASGALGIDVNLERVAFQLENAEYEPEQFPGLVYRMIQPRVAVLLFGTGRVVVAGAKEPNQVEEALWNLVEKLRALNELPPEYPPRPK
jgi:transcription initiation factor TFIID TATA-box-binding protein